MKIITLNTWGGRIHDPLITFLQNNRPDIFCMQEVYHEAEGKDLIWEGANLNTFRDIKNTLKEYEAFYHPHLEDWWGLASFVHKDIHIEEVGEKYVHLYKRHDLEREKYGHTAKNIQYIKTVHNNKSLSILNFHGLWNGMGKNDSEDRLTQSKNIVGFLNQIEGDIVFCGDFNLLPDTQSIKMIENAGMRNLVSEYGVTSTRTSYYTKPEKFADYIFVSRGVQVEDFKVLRDEVSDHAPLYIEIS